VHLLVFYSGWFNLFMLIACQFVFKHVSGWLIGMMTYGGDDDDDDVYR